MNKTIKTLLIGFALGFLLSFFSLGAYISAPCLTELYLFHIFPFWEPVPDYLNALPLLLLLVLLPVLLLGCDIKNDLSRTGVFVFTRQKNRAAWYSGFVLKITTGAMLYSFGYVFGVALLPALICGITPEIIRILLSAGLCLSALNALFVLICNVFSVFLSSAISTCCACGICLVFIALSFLTYNTRSIAYLLNPVSCGICPWQRLPFILSIAVLVMWLSLAVLSGFCLIKRCDIIGEIGE